MATCTGAYTVLPNHLLQYDVDRPDHRPAYLATYARTYATAPAADRIRMCANLGSPEYIQQVSETDTMDGH